LLVDQILWVLANLVPLAVLYGVILGLWFGLRARLGRPGFYLLFAVSLIIPALATRGIQHERCRLFTGYSVGIVGYGVGLMLSALLDLPTGAVIVLSLAVIGALVALVNN
jgi:zinc/manganese transport system permease protein